MYLVRTFSFRSHHIYLHKSIRNAAQIFISFLHPTSVARREFCWCFWIEQLKSISIGMHRTVTAMCRQWSQSKWQIPRQILRWNKRIAQIFSAKVHYLIHWEKKLKYGLISFVSKMQQIMDCGKTSRWAMSSLRFWVNQKLSYHFVSYCR